jgi:hypothetical protein
MLEGHKMAEKRTRKTIEEVASEYLEGNILRNFVDFHEFAKNNGLTVTKPSKILRGGWKISYENKKIGGFKIWDKNFWFCGVEIYKNLTDAETYEKYITADQKKFLTDNFRTTPPCCKGKDNFEFFGKVYNTVCTCWPHFQGNPEGEALEYAKQLILANKSVAADIAAKK